MKKPYAPAPLSAGLIKKGNAVPTPAVASGEAAVSPAEAAKSADAQVAKSAPTYHKALTLKLDEARYRKLKMTGLDLDLTSQDILVMALDQWLLALDAAPPGGAASPD